MPRMFVQRWLIVLAGAGVFVGWLWSDRAPAPPVTAGEPKKKANSKLVKIFFGNKKACGGDGCHGRMTPAPAGEETVDDVSVVLSRRHELLLWDTQDKHKIATKVLAASRGLQIAKAMGIKGEIADPKANHQWRQCLSCHGVVIDNEKQADKKSFGPQDRLDSGVSCVVCHAPYANWVVEHSKTVLNEWQTFTREQKEDQFGLRDLWDPVKRAELCSSCHVGNIAEGKIVTHEMYAAGHPPLPPFEILTFSDVLPRHWETSQEKYQRLPKSRALYDKIYHFRDDYEVQQVRLLLTSAVIALRNSVQLIAAHAQADQQQTGERAWPEFALYDCYACHHDLQSDSWRQKRGYAGKPGRPQMTEWPTVLMPLAIQHAGSERQAEFAQKLDSLTSAFSDTPFGDRAKVAVAARDLAQWSEGLLDALKKTPLDRMQSRQLLLALAERPRKLLDFDSARQTSWALKALLGDLQPASLNDAEVKGAFDALNKNLKLDLIKGQKPIVGPFLEDVMSRLANYDPDDFQRNMKVIAAAIAKKK
jgi:hypothetical protein